MSDNYTKKNYDKDFSVGLKKPKGKQKLALDRALDIRKFEIQLYWERAKYFWAFIAAAFAGYGAIQALKSQADKDDLSVYVSCLSIVFSFGWYCVNRGSKQWQENWENHVDLLENDIIGPLYKVVLRRPKPKGINECLVEHITGPYPVSVSKINQIISIYVTFLWIFLLFKSLPEFNVAGNINWDYVVIIGATILTCILFLTLGKTYRGNYSHVASKRNTQIDSA